jgi:hypothetical protein
MHPPALSNELYGTGSAVLLVWGRKKERRKSDSMSALKVNTRSLRLYSGGIWQMLKRALPESARARVSFPTSLDELHEHIDPEELSAGKHNI